MRQKSNSPAIRMLAVVRKNEGREASIVEVVVLEREKQLRKSPIRVHSRSDILKISQN
jgi:hypothetical protein